MIAPICAWRRSSIGVHVGQDDLSPESRRARSLGRTAGSAFRRTIRNSCARRIRHSADYLAIGPVFATSSKEKPDPVVGLEGVRRARALDAQAAGSHRRDYAGECGFGDRGRGGFGRGDIRPVTGSSQISRGIFPHLGVKSCQLGVRRSSPGVSHLADQGV